jgi:hypothetical protein
MLPLPLAPPGLQGISLPDGTAFTIEQSLRRCMIIATVILRQVLSLSIPLSYSSHLHVILLP